MNRWRCAAAAAVLAVLSTAACGTSTGEAAAPVGPTTTTTTAVPTTTRPITSTTALPPSTAVDGDPLAGNLSTEPIEWLTTDIDDESVPNRLTATNRSAMPIELALDFSESSNVSAEPAFPAFVIVPPLATVDAATIRPVDPTQSWSYSITTHWELGDPAASPAATTYLRPLDEDGRPAPIGQRPGGGFSHDDAANRWAYDFTLPTGTPVVAARAGTVATIDQGFTEAGTTPEFGTRGNSVRVLHDDGTYAIYLHLDPRSARVRIGDRVEAGQVLALSGNTGLSKGPHLHLALMANRDHETESIEFALEGE